MRPRRRGRWPLLIVALQLAAALVLHASLFAPVGSNGRATTLLYCLADESPDEEEDDFLAEILAEQAREEEEHARMEAEAREFDAMKAREHSSSKSGGGGGGGAPAGPKMGGPNRTMPGGANFSKLDEDLKKKEAENATKKASKEEERAAQNAERTRLKREAAFEAELKKMNEEQRKRARKQKARDAKVVKRILKAHASGRHYAVLGIRNLELKIGPFYFLNFSLGPLVLFRVKTKDVKRIYRNLARTVHPDKNKDGRAEEAFHALEASAAVLTDEKKRTDYDKRIASARRRRNKYAMEAAAGASRTVWRRSATTVRAAKRVLGPFSTPILVVGALII